MIKEIIKEKNIKLCGDIIFKAIFLREKEILLKMIYDITNISETMHYEEVLTGYELEPYKINGKVNKSDMLIKLGENYFVNLEINYKHENNVTFRNMIQLFRICIQVAESGMTDKELSKKEIGQLNFNTFSNINNKEIQKGLYTDEEGNILNNLLTFWNIDIVKCYKKVYNNIRNVQNLPKAIRWGAILYTDINDTKFIKKVIGDDLLTMEQRVKLISRINDVKDDKKIIQEWMVIENNRMREENILRTAKEEGLKQGAETNRLEMIKNMLKENTDYNFISKITGKSISEIKEIQSSLTNTNI